MSVLELHDVTKTFGNTKALDSVSFCSELGDVIGLVGPNGAGKTTLFRIALGLLQPDTGSVSVLGQRNIATSRLHIGYCLDSDGLYGSLTAQENMKFFATAYESDVDCSHLLTKCGLSGDRWNAKVNTYSRGMRKRLALARSFICKPQLLLLDEPLLGLDPEGQVDLCKILHDLGNECSIIISSHDLSIVNKICTRLLILNTTTLFDGKIKELDSSGSEDSLFQTYLKLVAEDRQQKRMVK